MVILGILILRLGHHLNRNLPRLVDKAWSVGEIGILKWIKHIRYTEKK